MKLLPLPPDIAHFQLGYLSESVLSEVDRSSSAEDELENKGYSPATTAPSPAQIQYIGVRLARRRVIFRRCLSGSTDDSSIIPCDFRVQQLLKLGNEQASSLESSNSREVNLAQHIILHLEDRDGTEFGSETITTGGLFQRAPSTMKFDDALACTSKDVEILKSGAIKMMRLTVICVSKLDGNSAGSCTNRNEKSKGSESNWKRLEEKIRLIFQTYEIHVGRETLVDLKNCQLASFQTLFSPQVRFVFVEDCEIISKKNKTDVKWDIGKVSGKTEIVISKVHTISHYERLLEMGKAKKEASNGAHLYGLEDAACTLAGMIKTSSGRQAETGELPVTCRTFSVTGLFTEFSHGLLISGPSGCGKVVVVRETARKLGAHLLSFNPSFGVVEQEAPSKICAQLTAMFRSALVTASRYQTVLFFPRIHLLFQQQHSVNLGSTAGVKNNNTARVLHHLCQLFDSLQPGTALTVVATTDKTYLVPDQLRRAGRLEKEIIISPPKESDRLAILQQLSNNTPAFRNVDFKDVACQTPGYVAQDLLKVLRLAMFKCQEEAQENIEAVVMSSQMKYAVQRVIPSVLEGALGIVDIQRAISLDHIAGLHSVKQELIKAVLWPLKHPEAFFRMGISPPKGILLYGPPGNCKTTLVRAVAATHQTNFLSVSAAELFSSGVGDSEKIVAHLFHRARMASPSILFIDELEAIVGNRQSSEKKQTGTNESILSMLLTEMDGVGTARIHHSSNENHWKKEKEGTICHSLGPTVLVVAATNRPDLIDPALLRPGRFDKLIPVPPLDKQGRKDLLLWCARSTPFYSNIDFDQLAESTEYFSGADVVNLCKEAALAALSESLDAETVADRHLNIAMSTVSPSLNSEMINKFYAYGKNVQKQQ